MRVAAVLTAVLCMTLLLGCAGRHVGQLGTIETLGEGAERQVLAVQSVAFSPNGKLALAAKMNSVQAWEVLTGQEKRRWDLPSHWTARQAIFSPDGNRVLAWGLRIDHNRLSGWMALWDLRSGAIIQHFDGQPSMTSSAAFSRDGRRILSCGGTVGSYGPYNPTVWIWDVASGHRIQSFDLAPKHPLSSVVFTHSDRQILVSADDVIYVCDIGSGKKIDQFPTAARQMVLSKDGKRLLCCDDQKASLIDLQTRAVVRNFILHELEADPKFDVWESHNHRGVAFAAEETQVVTASYGGPMLWDISTGRRIARWKGHEQMTRCVAVSPDGKLIMTGGEDSTIRLWDARDRGSTTTLPTADGTRGGG